MWAASCRGLEVCFDLKATDFQAIRRPGLALTSCYWKLADSVLNKLKHHLKSR